MDDSIRVLGNLEIIKKDENNNIVETRTVPNLVVAEGKKAIIQRMVHDFGDGNTTIQPFGGRFGRMAIGSNADAVAASDTTLGKISTANSEVQSVSPLVNVISDATVTYTVEFPGKGDGLTHNIREAAVFNSPTANTGNMLCRTTFSTIEKGSTTSLTVNWNITVA